MEMKRCPVCESEMEGDTCLICGYKVNTELESPRTLEPVEESLEENVVTKDEFLVGGSTPEVSQKLVLRVEQKMKNVYKVMGILTLVFFVIAMSMVVVAGGGIIGGVFILILCGLSIADAIILIQIAGQLTEEKHK